MSHGITQIGRPFIKALILNSRLGCPMQALPQLTIVNDMMQCIEANA